MNRYRNWFLVGATLLLVGLVVWYWQTLLTLSLIWQVSPYQQLVPGAPTILVVGDSTAYGTGATRSSESTAGLIAQNFPEFSVLTTARNALTSEQLYQCLVDMVPPEEYAAIIVQIGGNDILRDIPLIESKRFMRMVLEQLQQYSDTVLWLHSGNVGGATRFSPDMAAALEQRTRSFRAMAKQLSGELGVHYVDLFLELAEDPFIANPRVYLARDGLHPSSAGYRAWFAELQPILEAAFATSTLSE